MFLCKPRTSSHHYQKPTGKPDQNEQQIKALEMEQIKKILGVCITFYSSYLLEQVCSRGKQTYSSKTETYNIPC